MVAAIQSGRPVFRKQKLLFSLLPARKRLVFNRSLICFEPRNSLQQKPEDLSGLVRFSLQSESRQDILDFTGRGFPELSTSSIVRHLVGKAFLFLPRFCYLLVWFTIWKLRRAR